MSSYLPDYRPFRHNPRDPYTNLAQDERWISALGGGLLTLLGARRGGAGGALTALAGAALVQRGLSGHCAVYENFGISTADPEPAWVRLNAPRRRTTHRGEIHVESAVTIDRPAQKLYDWWHDFTNLPRVIRHLKAVTVTGNQSHWTMRTPINTDLEWDAETIEDCPGEVIGWQSLENSDVMHRGLVRFRPAAGHRGTEVRLKMDIAPPAGAAGMAVARLLRGVTEQQAHEDLRRFKQLMETGELATIDGQPHGAA